MSFSYIDFSSILLGIVVVMGYLMKIISDKKTPTITDIATIFFGVAMIPPGIYFCVLAVQITAGFAPCITISPLFLFFGGISIVFVSLQSISNAIKKAHSNLPPK